ncbi:MAG: tyrosine-type recombinase/integrase [Alicyclobacillus sp.]|nr:tyrosine-type recombinase/integrase [Alicyclobacillus sp.]
MGTEKALLQQVDSIFRHSRQGSIKTRERYRETGHRLAKFLGEQFRMKNLKNLQDKHVEAYVRSLQEAGRSVAHIKTELSAIRWLADQIGVKRPLEDARAFNERMGIGKRSFRGHDRTWSEDELALIAHAPDRIRRVLTLARELGLRIHEIHRLDVASAREALRQGELRVKGKGGLVRSVPLRGMAGDVLREALSETRAGQKLFVPDEMLTHEAIRQVQDYVRAHRPEGSRVTTHGLRHAYARDRYLEFRSEGLSDIEAKRRVSELLGHHRAEVTDIYLGSLR